MKYTICFLFIVFSFKCFCQQRREKVTYLCIDRTENSKNFVEKLSVIITSLNQKDSFWIGRFFFPDEVEASAYYDESSLKSLKDTYSADVGSIFICFEISNFKNPNYVDERILSITVVNLKSPAPVKEVIMRKNVLLHDLESIVIPTIKFHLLKIFIGEQKTKPSLLIYEDGAHIACDSHIDCYNALFNNPKLLSKFYIKKIDSKMGDGKTISANPSPNNDFVYKVNGSHPKTFAIDCSKPFSSSSLDNFLNSILIDQ